MAKVNADHNCVRMKCKGDKLGELHVNCNRCGKKWFIECLKDEDEIYELTKAIGLIKIESDSNGEIKVTAQVTDTKKEIFNTIMGKDSPIEYVCLQCKKKEGSTRTKIAKIEKQIVDMKEWKQKQEQKQEQEINEYKAKLLECEEKVKEMKIEMENDKHKINENQETINALTQTIEEKDALIEQSKNNTQHGTLEESENEDESGSDEHGINNVNAMKKLIKSAVTKQLKTEMDRMQKMIEEIRNSVGKTKHVRFSDETIASEYEEDVDEFDGNGQNKRNIHFDQQMIPTKQMNRNYRTNKVYEMYVSKFECDMSVEIIEQHITTNTSLSTQTFSIEEIRSSSSNGRTPNYKAFKITTLKREIYEEILEIWAPHYNAREFKRNTNERGQTTRNINNTTPNTTPNKTYNTTMNSTRNRTNKRNWQLTPNKTVSQNGYGQNRTPNIKTNETNTEKTITMESGAENGATRPQNDRQSMQQQQYQQRNNRTNTPANFLARQSQQYQQGVSNTSQQGANYQYQMDRTKQQYQKKGG